MDTYIVRIYRRDKKDPKKVAGVVESVGKEGKKSFSGPDALWTILSVRRRKPERKEGIPRSARNGEGAMTLSDIMKKIARGKG